MKRTITALLLGVAFVLFTGASAQAADCEYRLGFKTLRDLIGHHIVGECLENEHYNAIGDSNQQSTGGLMAWRKADNWTAFTDGYRTWINGPNGLVQAFEYGTVLLGGRPHSHAAADTGSGSPTGSYRCATADHRPRSGPCVSRDAQHRTGEQDSRYLCRPRRERSVWRIG